MKLKEDIKIFIVDDDPFCRKLYKQQLSVLGFKNTLEFSNGQDCINEIIQEPVVVFLDYEMMPMNGMDTLKKIKRFDPSILCIMVSGQQDMQVAVNTLKYGAFDYIIKGKNEMETIAAVMQKVMNVIELLAQPQPNKWAKLFPF